MYLIITFNQFLLFIVAMNKKYTQVYSCDSTRDCFFISLQIIHYEAIFDSFLQDKHEKIKTKDKNHHLPSSQPYLSLPLSNPILQ